MKYFLLLFLIAPVAYARAETCATFLPCGTYVGTTTNGNGETEITTVEIKGVNELEAVLTYTYEKGGKRSSWPVTMKFTADGAFQGLYEGVDSYLAGFCGKQVCTIAMVPELHGEGREVGITGTLRPTTKGLDVNFAFGTPERMGARTFNLIRQ